MTTELESQQPARGLALGALRARLIGHDEELATQTVQAIARLGPAPAAVAVGVWAQVCVRHVRLARTGSPAKTPIPSGLVLVRCGDELMRADDPRLPARFHWAAQVMVAHSAGQGPRVTAHLQTLDRRTAGDFFAAVLDVAASTIAAPPRMLRDAAA